MFVLFQVMDLIFPVLLVKERGWPNNGNILASVHVGSENPAHLALNHKMVEEYSCYGVGINPSEP